MHPYFIGIADTIAAQFWYEGLEKHFSNTFLLNASYQPITLNDADATRIELHWLEYWSCVSYKGKSYCTVQVCATH